MNDQVVMQDDDDDLGEIFGHDTEYKTKDLRTKKKFSPWHRPRKQFIREEQWCAEINSLVDTINFDGRPLRYIGLPGNELFDLRTIHELICKPRELRLKFLGFNNSSGVEDDAGFELNLSTVEVRELERVDGTSKVMPDDFKSLGARNSIAWSNAREFGHYDVVNVDLCDGLFAGKPQATSESYYNAIQELINLQACRGEPWLLFMTSRVGANVVHSDTVTKLKGLIERNLKDCQNFAKATKRHLDFESMSEVEALLKESKGFSDLFITGVTKWLISLGLSSTPQWRVSLKSIWNYTVYPEATYPDLLSLAFEFAPVHIPAQDRAGLATNSKGTSTPKPPSECMLAADAVPCVATAINVDSHLEKDPATKAKYVEKSANLYEKARYPGADYSAWLVENNY